jgi:radical SAM superfamily enzyme YgiQ (UPF0313 family)
MSFTTVFVDFSCNFYDKHWVYCLASHLRASGTDVRYVNERDPAKTIKFLQSVRPGLVAYSAFSSELRAVIEFDRGLKRALDVKSILGGPAPTYDWTCHADTTIDAVCVGEGEFALQEYIESGCTAARNVIPRGASAPPGLHERADLDTLPFPDRDMVYQEDPVVRRMNSKQFLSGRGCPYACTYCFNHVHNRMFHGCGPVVRKKSVDYLIEEIGRVRAAYPLTTVVFQDDTFIQDKDWFIEFADRFPSRVGLPYTCNIRANLMSEDIAEALSRSGCVAVNWSIESGDEEFREKRLHRNMTRDQIIETGRLLREHGIQNRIGNLIGLPGERFDQMLATLELNIEVKPSLGLANIFVPFPALELTEYAQKEGYLDPENATNLPRDFFTRSVLNFTPGMHRRIRKLMPLFPIFVRFPRLYRTRAVRAALFALPVILLRIVYELFYVYTFASLYRVKNSFGTKLGMLARYIRNLR